MICNGNFYSKYIVNSLFVFLLFVLVGMIVFILLANNTEISVIETYEGNYADNRLIINEIVEGYATKAYVYKNRSDYIETFQVYKVEYFEDSYTVLYINDNDKNLELDGTIKIELEKKTTSLLHIVLGIEKKYAESYTKIK